MSKKENLGDLITENKENAEELSAADKKSALNKDEIEKKISKLIIVNKETALKLSAAYKIISTHKKEIKKREAELIHFKKELAFQAELSILNKKLVLANEQEKLSKEKYIELYNFAPTGYVSLSNEKIIQEINCSGARMLGKEGSKLIGSHFGFFVSKNTLFVFNSFYENILNGKASEICEVMIVTQGNKPKYVHIEGLMVDGNNKQCLLNVIDITERKWAEDELKSSLEQLHQLTQHIEKVREDERVAISRELHDELGQALTAVKIDLTIIRRSISDSEVVLKINKVAALVGETIKTVQRITSQLRLEIIDDLGLKAAIEWYTKEFSQRIGVKMLLDIDSAKTISPKASLVIFRIIQESLTNIARHAKATSVDISLLKTGEFIRLRILDNGIGIKGSEINSKKSFGIMIMKERAASLGGTFDISRESSGGTIIMLIIPIIEQLNS